MLDILGYFKLCPTIFVFCPEILNQISARRHGVGQVREFEWQYLLLVAFFLLMHSNFAESWMQEMKN